MKNINTTDILKIKQLLEKIFGESDYLNLKRLGGLTNHTYLVEMRNGVNYVVRLPGAGTEEMINRSHERISTELACALKIDAHMLYFGPSGEKVTAYIDGAITMCPDSFLDEAVLRKAASVLRVLHTSGADTKVPFDVFDMASSYEKIIRDNSVAPFEGYESVKAQIMTVRNCVKRVASVDPVPCHNDPLCENWVMDRSGKLFLIDWEYAGMNDGMWDLADLSIEASMSEAQETVLLRSYLQRDPEKEEYLRFYANKLYLDFLWALWGKARVPFDGEAMEEYGLARYVRLKDNLAALMKWFTD